MKRGNNHMSQYSRSEDWRRLAEQASKETDPKRLIELVSELSQALKDEQAMSSAPSLRSVDLRQNESGVPGIEEASDTVTDA